MTSANVHVMHLKKEQEDGLITQSRNNQRFLSKKYIT